MFRPYSLLLESLIWFGLVCDATSRAIRCVVFLITALRSIWVREGDPILGKITVIRKVHIFKALFLEPHNTAR